MGERRSAPLAFAFGCSHTTRSIARGPRDSSHLFPVTLALAKPNEPQPQPTRAEIENCFQLDYTAAHVELIHHRAPRRLRVVPARRSHSRLPPKVGTTVAECLRLHGHSAGSGRERRARVRAEQG